MYEQQVKHSYLQSHNDLDRSSIIPEESEFLKNRQIQSRVKRFVDLFVTVVALVFFGPLLIVIFGLVALDGGHPIYRHTRIGQNGREFSCYKFRSMRRNGDALLAAHLASDADAAREWHATRKLRRDPRITAVGRFLRQTSLDELPQLFNVLKGDMSLVGPRPVTSEELALYGDKVGYYLSAVPGITGLWQVSGRNELSYEQRVELDVRYVTGQSLWLDLAILLKTLHVVFFREGAY